MLLVGFMILQGLVTFLYYQRLVEYDISWLLFVPFVAAGICGSISGALISMRIEIKTGASVDAHVTAPEAPKPVLWPIAVLFPLVLIEFLFMPQIVLSLLAVYGLAVAMRFSFMLVSRARNRDNILYHALASIFSNGIWFLTFKQLYDVGLELPFLVPYIVGVASGSLLAYNVSIWIERRIKAVADAPAKKVAAN